MRQVETLLGDGRWSDATTAMNRLTVEGSDALWRIAPDFYAPLSTYIQRRVAGLVEPGIRSYRERTDEIARDLFRQAVSEDDDLGLSRVVDHFFASSVGDEAALALGDRAHRAGDSAEARFYWLALLPVELQAKVCAVVDRPSVGDVFWMDRITSPLGSHPDPDPGAADVLARLVLASVLDGDRDRAERELGILKTEYPTAKGRFGGRTGVLAELVQAMLDDAAAWPDRRDNSFQTWPTFAGNDRRNAIATGTNGSAESKLSATTWRLELPAAAATGIEDTNDTAATGFPFHPILADGLLLVGGYDRILAIDAATGRPAFGVDSPVIYQSLPDDLSPLPADVLGQPLYTLTHRDGRLLARLGTGITVWPTETDESVLGGYVVCLDMRAEGRLLWKFKPTGGWAVEGTPLADDRGVYVSLRRTGAEVESSVACLDSLTGRVRWQRPICRAAPVGAAKHFETTHNLVTLAGRTLYVNTNLGVIAAVSTVNGRIRWARTYARTDPPAHRTSAPSPCLYDRGRIVVAPTDTSAVMTLDASTGSTLWQSETGLSDVTHLLATTDRHIIATGSKVYWIEATGTKAGQVAFTARLGQLNETRYRPRGIVTETEVLWTHDGHLQRFDRTNAWPHGPIEDIGDGNLLTCGRQLLVVGRQAIVAWKNSEE